MYSDTTFSKYNSELDKFIVYAANTDGSLIKNSWKYAYRSLFYFGDDYASYVGKKKVGDKEYVFGESGLIKDGAFSCDDGNYICSFGGVYKKIEGNNKWIQDGSDWYYIKDNEFVVSDIIKLGSGSYAFDDNGKMLSNIIYDLYISNSGYTRVCATKDGKLLENGYFYDDDGNRRLVKDFSLVNGIQTIDGKSYYFESGIISKNDVIRSDNRDYVTDKDGVIVDLKNNAWTKVDGQWVYVKNNKVLSGTVENINGKLYGFDYYGRMYANSIFGIFDETEGFRTYAAGASGEIIKNNKMEDVYGIFFADETGNGFTGIKVLNGVKLIWDNGYIMLEGAYKFDGKCYACNGLGNIVELKNNQWSKVGNQWYYVENNNVVKGCIKKINGSQYAFYYNGSLCVNDTIYIDEDYYATDSNGSLIMNSWVDGSYFDETGCAVYGMKTIDGKKYLFEHNYKPIKNSFVEVSGQRYIADSNGILQVLDMSKQGWIKAGTNYFYIENGRIVLGEILKIGDKYYAFDSAGIMYENELVYLNGHVYAAQKGGALVVNDSVTLYDEKYYFDSNGNAYDGLKTLNGIQYLFDDGAIVKNQARNIDGKSYVFDMNGKKIELKDNTWCKVDGKYYYSINGQICMGGIYEIGCTLYYFDWNGQMACNEFVFPEECSENYYATSSGALAVNTNMNINGKKYYFNSKGQIYQGVHEIDGKLYIFEDGVAI